MARSVDGLSVPTKFPQSENRRPPGSVIWSAFRDLCDGCGQCAEICPKGGIVIGSDGYPVLVASSHKCGRCHLCIDVCTRGALENPSDTEASEIDSTALKLLIRKAVPGITARIARRN